MILGDFFVNSSIGCCTPRFSLNSASDIPSLPPKRICESRGQVVCVISHQKAPSPALQLHQLTHKQGAKKGNLSLATIIRHGPYFCKGEDDLYTGID
jgi:hypothetical protein